MKIGARATVVRVRRRGRGSGDRLFETLYFVYSETTTALTGAISIRYVGPFTPSPSRYQNVSRVAGRTRIPVDGSARRV